MTAVTAIRPMISEYCAPSGEPFSAPFSSVNTVWVLFMFNSDEPPMIQMFTEYRPVFTMMPAKRLFTPMRVCSTAVTRPDSMPAPIAAGSDSQGWPAMAVTAPTTAPRVKQPSVDRSHTFSIE